MPMPAQHPLFWRRASAAVARLIGITDYDAAQYYTAPDGGGESGVSSGYVTVLLYQPNGPVTSERMFARLGAYNLDRNSDIFTWQVADGSQLRSVLLPVPSTAIVPIIARHTGSAIALSAGPPLTARVVTTPASGQAAPQAGAGFRFGSGGNRTPGVIIDFATFRGTPTDAQLDEYVQRVRSLGYLPQTMQGATITHRTPVAASVPNPAGKNGQTGPSSLMDVVTNASVDALALVTATGSPRLREIDLTTHGRRSLGVSIASTGPRLQTAAGTGPRGSTAGHWMAFEVDLRAGAGATEWLVEVGHQVDGFRIGRITSPGADRIEIYCFGAVNVTTSSANLIAADYAEPQLLLYTYDGTTHTVQLARGVVISGSGGYVAPAAASRRTTLANSRAGDYPTTNGAVYRVAAGDVPLTQGEIDAMYATWSMSRTLAPPVGKTSWFVDLTQDVNQIGAAAEIPAQVQDRSSGGTAHLARAGAMGVSTGPNAIRRIGPFGSTQVILAQPGIAGAATGFHLVLDVVLDELPTTGQTIASQTAGTAGWYLGITASGIRFVQTGVAATPFFPLNSGHVGQRLRIVAQHTGAALHLEVNGTAVADVASASYTVPNAPLIIGSYPLGVEPFTSGGVELVQGGNTVLTAAEIYATNASGAAAPPVIAGKTQKRWVFEQDIAANGGALPATFAERVAGAAVDAAPRLGAGLIVARRTERRWGWETTPCALGIRGLSASNYASVVTSLMAGATTPYWFIVAMMVHARTGGAIQTIVGKSRLDGLLGGNLYAQSTMASIVYTHGSGSAPVVAPVYTITDGDIGRFLILGYQWTGSALQAFAKRAQNGANVAAPVFAPYGGAMCIGRHADSTLQYPGSDAFTVYGVMGGIGSVISLPEYQSAYDGFAAEEDLVAIQGKTSRLWSIRRAQNGTLQPTPDAQGSGEVLGVVGTPALSASYTHYMAA